MSDPLVYARAVHFAATIMAAGVVFFAVFIAEPALREAPAGARIAARLRSRLAWVGWITLSLALLSDAAWLVFTAASMSGQPVADVLSQGVVWTVLSQTDFGNDWLARFAMACILAGLFVPLLSAKETASVWLKAAATTLAVFFVGSLAFAGHAIGAQGLEGVLHPAADIVHLIAAAAWLGALLPLALLLAMTGGDDDALTAARTATLRFSTLGIASVAAILITGIVNSWYLVGSIPAFTETEYGQLLLIKIALFALMVSIACINRLWLTPRLVDDSSVAVAQSARRALCRNAAIEALIGGLIIAIVAVLGTLAPASHVNLHAAEGALPSDASFQHIHSENGMANVLIEPGRVGTASVTIQLLNDDFKTLATRSVTLTLRPPTPGSAPIMRTAREDTDEQWQVDSVELTEPGNWMVTVDAVLSSNRRLQLTAPIVIDAK